MFAYFSVETMRRLLFSAPLGASFRARDFSSGSTLPLVPIVSKHCDPLTSGPLQAASFPNVSHCRFLSLSPSMPFSRNREPPRSAGA